MHVQHLLWNTVIFAPQNPFTDNSELQQRTARMLTLNTWDVAVALTSLDWAVFHSVHEVWSFKRWCVILLFCSAPDRGRLVSLQQELVYFTFSRHSGGGSRTVALELLLQRCNEVQLWVMTEVLLCPLLCKRVQLIKKFIKIAAQLVAHTQNLYHEHSHNLNYCLSSLITLKWDVTPSSGQLTNCTPSDF